MFRHRIVHVELLNQIGRLLDSGLGSREAYHHVVDDLRGILELDALLLWVRDPRHRLLIKEAQAVTPGFSMAADLIEYDKNLARWQMHNGCAIASSDDAAVTRGPARPAAHRGFVVSLPLQFQEETMGALNLYFGSSRSFQAEQPLDPGRSELLRAIAGQMSVFVHARSQVANTTFYKEIHHRIKNNLQTVAALLRMQQRRLDETSAERALTESVQRIQSIALVHETLSEGDIGLLDLGDLARRVCRLLPRQAQTDLEVCEDHSEAIQINSKQATALALIINELVDNAMQHNPSGAGRISVQVGEGRERLYVKVHNSGSALPPGFDTSRDGSLGLAIVRTLVHDELKGDFELGDTGDGVLAQVRFPPAESALSGIGYDHGI